MTLYEINAEYERALESCIDEETGEILDTEALDQIQDAFEDKVDAICCIIKTYEAEAAAIKAEKMALAKRQASKESRAKWLREYLEKNLNGQSFESARNRISYRKSVKVQISVLEFMNNENADLYLTFKEPEPNKTAIKKAIEAGEELEGVQLVECQNMQIK